MRKSTLLAAALVPVLGLAGLATYAVPALASDDDDCPPLVGAGLLDLNPGPIDLDAIPVGSTSGNRVLTSDDDCDEHSLSSSGSSSSSSLTSDDDDHDDDHNGSDDHGDDHDDDHGGSDDHGSDDHDSGDDD